MEVYQHSMDTLLQIERQIYRRIEILSYKRDRLCTNKNLLRKHRELAKSLLSMNTHIEKTAKESKSPPDEGDISPFGKLDGILSLAKEIRTGVAKAGKQSHQEDKTNRTEGRQTLRDALSSNKKVVTKPIVDDILRGPTKEEHLLADLHEQLLFLTRHRLALSVSKLYMNRTKYSNESKFLSKLLTYPTQPRSTLFHVIYPTLPRNDEPDEPIVDRVSVIGGSVVFKLAQQFKSLLIHYERHLRQRVNHESYKLSQLSGDEKKAMVALWMRGRKLMELYQHYVKAKQRLQCTCEACSLVDKSRSARSDTALSTLDHATPSYAPLPAPSAPTELELHANVGGGQSKSKARNSGGSTSNSWVSACKARVETFHGAYQSKILLIAESAVGQEQLKGTIQMLKSCCEDSYNRLKSGEKSATKPGIDNCFVSKWVESLKQFRLVYSILLNEAQELNHCIFINKA